MIRAALLLLLLFAPLFSASGVDGRIAETSKTLKSFDRDYASVNTKMAKTAKSILKKQRTVLIQRKKIETLEAELQTKGTTLSSSRSDLETLTSQQEELEKQQRQLRKDLSKLLARIVSLAVIHDDNSTLSPAVIMNEEIFKSLNRQTQKQIAELSGDYLQNQKSLKALTQKTTRLKTEITQIENEKRELVTAKRTNEKALADLKHRKKKYKKELKKLLAQKDELQKTLRRLHIIQESETQKARAKAERERNAALLASKPLPKVKSVGSSYHRARTRRYRGKKTIAPLSGYTVLKRYGTYTDPIYKIKIFNESVSLQPKTRDAKVKAILNGKVILAQNTPLLENVVILEHSGGLHTIYAHLDQIAPTVKKGKWVKAGSIIGRVNDELMFEVTQKNYHIDPLQVIK
jgi:septal ring factor EnvC (AmiA/AmiB activator)